MADNPLVAQEKQSPDGPGPFTKGTGDAGWGQGIGIAESVNDVQSLNEGSSWVESGLAYGGLAMEAVSAVIDPIGTLLSYGLSWLIEHVQPLQDALDWFAGDPDGVAAYGETWANVSKAVAEAVTEYNDAVKADTADWTGTAGDAYRQHAAEKSEALSGASKLANTISTVVTIMGEVVSFVRDFVRDLVADCISRLITYALEALAPPVVSLAWVVPQAVAFIAKTVTKIGDVVQKLIKTISKVSPKLTRMAEVFGEVMQALSKMGKKGGPAGTKPAGADSPSPQPDLKPNGDTPDATKPTNADPTDPASAGKPTPGDSQPRSHDGKPQDASEDPQKTATEQENRRCEKDPIDIASGEMILAQTDVEIAASLPMVLRRTHLSSYRVGLAFGPSWASTLDQRLDVGSSGVSFVAEDGKLLFSQTPAPNATVEFESSPHTLTRHEDDSYTVTLVESAQKLYFARGNGVLPLTTITDRNGNRIDFDHDAAGVPTEIRHSGGYRIRVDSDDELITALYLCGADNGDDLLLMRYTYTDRRLTAVINASGLPLKFDYDGAGRITSWTDRNDCWYRYTYDHHGRCVRTEGSGGSLSGTLEYDTENGITYSVDSHGGCTTFHLNEAGQVVREIDPLGNETASEWDSYDRLLSRTDPLGRRVRYDYDEAGNLVAVTRPDRSQARFEYNDLRLPVTLITPDGTISRREYDEHGNLTRVIDPVGAVTAYGYENGQLSQVTDALGNVRRVDANVAGLPVAVTDALGKTTTYERDGFGRVTAITDPLDGTTRFGWTVDGKPAWRTLPNGATERWIYDGEGNLRTHVDAMGQTTQTEVTHFDLPSAEIRPDGTRLQFGYDTELRLVSVTNEQGLVWRYDYDPVGNLVQETDFNGRVVTYQHDTVGQLLERTNGVGESTQFIRDALGNVIERRTGNTTTTFAYDKVGQLLEAMDGDTQVTFQRDPLGRVLAETINGRTVASAYDPLGRRTRRMTPSGAESVWEYDANNQPVSLHTAGRTLQFGYDDLGRETQRSLGADVALVQAWDSNHRLVSQTVAGSAREIQHRSYTYRADGFLTGINDQLTGPRTFDLDAAGRVTAVQGSGWTERYVYDAAGNVASASWPVSGTSSDAESIGDREYSGTLIRRAGNVRYEHDAQGRVVLRQQKRLSHKPNTWRYFWDTDDRLIGVLTPDGSRWRYRYDPLGRRVAKQRLTPDASHVVEQTDFVWDGTVLAEQAHTDGRPNAQGLGDAHVTVWNYEPGTFRPLTQTERSPLRNAPQHWVDEQFYSIITDLVGSPTELINDQGGIAWFHRTTLWGNTLDHSHTDAHTPLRFPGQYADPETGFNYNHQRHYDPATGRYASTDPLGLGGGFRPHGYVANPHELIDPLGLMSCDPEEFGNRLGHEVAGWNSGRTAEVVDRINSQGMSQNDAAKAAEAASRVAFGGTAGRHALEDGRVVVLPAMEGNRAPVLIVDGGGTVSPGTANFKIAFPDFQVSEVQRK